MTAGRADAGSDDEAAPAFRAVGETTEWTGWRVSVGRVSVEAPGGELLSRDVLRHPGAVAVLPLHDDGTVTLVRQYRAPLDRDVWELPAGLRDVDGEPPEETARRELAEEAGLAASKLMHLLSFHNSPGHTDEQMVVFLATGLTEVPDDRQGAEEQHMAVARLGLDEALAMVDDGRITDAKTIIALLYAARSM